MTILGLLQALLSLANVVATFMHDRQLLDAGAAKATLAGIRSAQDAVVRATAARDRVSADLQQRPDKLRDDDGFKRKP